MLTIENRPVVVFSDFDGTITQRDVIVMIMEAFAPPVWRDIVDQILNQRTLSIKDGVTQLFQLIPASKKEDIEAFVRAEVKIRPGFETLLSFCNAEGVPFQVLSGGVDFFVHQVLASYRPRLDIFCNGASFETGPDNPDGRIQLTMPYYDADCTQCGQCACCKISLMDRFDREKYFRVAIGDSLTDLPMARVADLTFARGQLVDYCKEEDIAVTPYEDFHDVLNALQARGALAALS